MSRIMLALILLMVGIFFLIVVATGKGNELNGSLANIFSSMSCSENLGHITTYKDFMAVMGKVHNDCENNESNCGKITCATINFNTDSCYKVTRKSLDSYGLWYFSDLPLCAWASNKYNLACNEEEGLSSGGFIQYYGKTENCKVSEKWDCDNGYKGASFSIGNGATVKIMAKPIGLILKATDVKITVTGGDYSTCIDAPSETNCIDDDSVCNKNSHGFCNDNKICTYTHYCQHACDPISPTTDCTPDLNNPSDKKCIRFTVDCDADGTCPQTIAKCPTNNIKTDVKGIIEQIGGKKLEIDTAPAFNDITDPSGYKYQETEYFFKRNVLNKLTRGLGSDSDHAPDNSDTILSIETGKIDANNAVTIYQGCY